MNGYNGIAGIIPLEPGFKKIRIRPYLPKSMNTFSCSYQSVYGIIKVTAQRNADRINLTAIVPDEVDCLIDKSLIEGFSSL
ncbi:MAG: hypothetical protein LBQ38_01575 [Spirochaetaceae bacterium]|nr:hypothetical protein [Spirochaetaceae bacterium]